MGFTVSDDVIAVSNRAGKDALAEDYAHLGRQLGRRGPDIERLNEHALAHRVSVPPWGVGTGGTRFVRAAAGRRKPRSVPTGGVVAPASSRRTP